MRSCRTASRRPAPLLSGPGAQPRPTAAVRLAIWPDAGRNVLIGGPTPSADPLHGHGLVTKQQHVRCTTVPSWEDDAPGFSTFRAGTSCCSALKEVRNQQVLGSIPSAGSKSHNNLEQLRVRGRFRNSPLGCSWVAGLTVAHGGNRARFTPTDRLPSGDQARPHRATAVGCTGPQTSSTARCLQPDRLEGVVVASRAISRSVISSARAGLSGERASAT